jgi:hypothetical protein
MEWLGTKFALTLGGIRLRVHIALEDVPHEYARSGKAPSFAREGREHDGRVRRTYRLHPR